MLNLAKVRMQVKYCDTSEYNHKFKIYIYKTSFELIPKLKTTKVTLNTMKSRKHVCKITIFHAVICVIELQCKALRKSDKKNQQHGADYT